MRKNLQFFWDDKEKVIDTRFLSLNDVLPEEVNAKIAELEKNGERVAWLALDKDSNLFSIVYKDKNPFKSKLTEEERTIENIIKEAQNYNHWSPDKDEIGLTVRLEYIMMYWWTQDIMLVITKYHNEMVKAYDAVKYAIWVRPERKRFLEAVLFHKDPKNDKIS